MHAASQDSMTLVQNVHGSHGPLASRGPSRGSVSLSWAYCAWTVACTKTRACCWRSCTAPTWGCASESLARRLTPKPSSRALWLQTNGGSCHGSPTRTNRRLFSRGAKIDGRLICPASSTRQTSKSPQASSGWLTLKDVTPTWIVTQLDSCEQGIQKLIQKQY